MTPVRIKTSVVPIYVTEHARERARERSPGFKSARIIDEVREALHEGRISANKPPGFDGHPHRKCLYVWNDERAYAIKCGYDGFVVTTTVSRRKLDAS